MHFAANAGAKRVRFAAMAGAWLVLAITGSSAVSQRASAPDHSADASAYLNETLPQLIKRVPELRHLHPAESQAGLPVILQKTGERVDDFFRHITDLTAREEISLARLRQELPSSRPELSSERVRDSYILLRHGSTSRTDIVEYRTNSKGDNFDQAFVKQGYIVTSGFALTCNYFSTGFQPESVFRYLGEETVGPQNTYVVGFAQQPGKATLSVHMRSRNGTPAQMLVQGIAWIDKSSFQIVRLRTDLLAPRWDIGLNRQTTEVTLSKIQLADVPTPLWLPSSVKVVVEFTTHNGAVDEFFELSYRNEHRYTDYQRFRVATKIAPQ